MLNPLAGLFFVCLWLWNEKDNRRRLGLHPASWLEMYRLGQKKSTPDRRVPAAVFVLGIMFCFGLWESGLRFLLDRDVPWWLFAIGCAAGIFTLYFRHMSFRRPRPPHPAGTLFLEDIGLLVLSWTLIMGCSWTLVLAPWAWWRVKWMPRFRG